MSSRPTTELSQTLTALRPYQLRLGFFSLVTALLSLAPSVYMLQVYDRVVNSRNLATLGWLTLLVLCVYLLQVLLEGVRQDIQHRASRRLEHRLSSRIFDAMFAFRAIQSGVGEDQPANDLRTLAQFIASQTLQAFMEMPGSVLFLVCIFWISPTLGVAALVGAVAQTLVAMWTEHRTHPPLMQANRSAMQANTYLRGVLVNAQVIESMGMLQGIHERWMGLQRMTLSLQAKASDHAGLSSSITRVLQILQGSVLLGLGCWLALDGHLQGGMMIVASILGGKVLQPLVKVVTQWRMVVQAMDARERLEQFLQAHPPVAAQMPLPVPVPGLSVEGITVQVPGPASAARPILLHNVAFDLKPGTVLAVLGPSGSGKSTLARALLGLLPSVAGKVRLDGIDVHLRDKEQLGPYLGYLPQEVGLFDGTLAENIARLGTPQPELLDKACRLAGLEALIAQLPQGLDTPVGPDGAFLSGGQRQRIGLARALYGDPVMVVLDEPYSNLDQQGEHMILEVVSALKQRGATVILITHLSSMLAVADQVLLLRQGRVQAMGPRDQVLEAMQKARLAHASASGARAETTGGAR
ncbi:MAG: type I secretion system permease/ATPase [Limnohabitans sp.]